MRDKLKPYRRFFAESTFWQRLSVLARKLGTRTVYSALLLFYAYRRKDTPYWAKNIVIGALGYLLSPIDFLPDLTPIIGYTDDLGVLGFGLVTIAAYVNADVKTNARNQLKKWFTDIDESTLRSVDERL